MCAAIPTITPIVAVRRAHGWVVTLRIRAKISRTLRKRINGSFSEIVSHENFECKLYRGPASSFCLATAHFRTAENGSSSSPG